MSIKFAFGWVLEARVHDSTEQLWLQKEVSETRAVNPNVTPTQQGNYNKLSAQRNGDSPTFKEKKKPKSQLSKPFTRIGELHNPQVSIFPYSMHITLTLPIQHHTTPPERARVNQLKAKLHPVLSSTWEESKRGGETSYSLLGGFAVDLGGGGVHGLVFLLLVVEELLLVRIVVPRLPHRLPRTREGAFAKRYFGAEGRPDSTD